MPLFPVSTMLGFQRVGLGSMHPQMQATN